MDIIKRPIVTEKLSMLTERINRYGFIVDKNANKIQIKNAVEELYGVTVEAVNTARYSGKKTNRYTKNGFVTGKKPAFKKAYVTLADDEKIDFYSNI